MVNINSFKIFSLLFLTIFLSSAAYSQSKPYSWKFEKSPSWSDEFSEDGLLDTSKWSYDVGGDGWGNNELQYYTNGENAVIKDGVLQIIASNEKKSGRKYTSSRMLTKGKEEWLYGRLEVSAKIPQGRGLWPAIWMLPAENYYGKETKSGEIDVVEFVGFEPGKANFSVHTETNNSRLGNAVTSNLFVINAADSFHVYRMDWTPYGIRGYIDNIKYFEYDNERYGNKKWPFDKKFFLILNVAIGGNWGGQKGINKKIFPAKMEVDYVRIYSFIK